MEKINSNTEIPKMYISFEGAGYYLLSGEIDNENTSDAIKYIVERNLNFHEQRESTEIRMMINSIGGDLCSGFALIDIMRSSEIDVATFGLGTIASAGLAIFMAGKKGKRYITQNTSILSHQFSWGSWGKEHELYARNKEFELTTQRMLAHYKKCTGLNEKKIKEILLPPQDVWLSAEEAVRYGIADKIVEWY
jgi:ATP-dependent Clp endopeptidase proteolytic subunit ClpP